jgi:hypothetical protein
VHPLDAGWGYVFYLKKLERAMLILFGGHEVDPSVRLCVVQAWVDQYLSGNGRTLQISIIFQLLEREM